MATQPTSSDNWIPDGRIPADMDTAVAQFLRWDMSYLPPSDDFEIAELLARMDQHFAEFLAEVDADDDRYRYGYESEDEPDTGHIARRGTATRDGYYDHKDFFHFRMELLDRPVYQAYRAWMLECAELTRRCRRRVSEFLRHLDQALPGHRLHEQICTDETIHDDVIRLIHYRETRPGTEVIARRHRGRAGVVLALWENNPGLVANIEGEWRPIGSFPNCPLVFAGQRLVQLTDGKVRALEHEVVNVPGAEKVERRAIVGFFDPHRLEVVLPTH